MSDAEHDALTLARDLERIANTWGALNAQLAGTGGGDRSGVHVPPGSKPPISAHVVDVMTEIEAWAAFLAHALIDETDWTAPKPPTTPAVLRSIATTRVGHFTEHPDEGLRTAVTDDAHRLALLANRTAYPTGKRTIRLGLPCEQHATTDLGERVPCTGQYATVLDPDAPLADLVCTKDPEHRITPLAWQRAQRHDAARDRNLDQLMKAGQIRHTS